MVEASPNSLILVDSQGKIVYANAFTERLFQYKKEELHDQSLEILVPNRFKDHHPSFLHMYLKNPKTRQMGNGRDLFAIKKDGQEFPVEIGLNPIKTKDGMHVLAAIIDITERKKAELLRQKNAKELEMKNTELEQFTYIASHDLQEPLNTIISWTDLLVNSDKYELDLEPDIVYEYITDSATRMKSLINGLLEYCKLGKNAEVKEIDSTRLVESVLDDLRASIIKSKATVHFDGLPKVWGYELELRLLFQNLIGNAIKFQKQEVPPDIFLSAKIVNHAWQFSIKDNGIGIKEKDQKKIFTIFQQLNEKSDYEGSGIGLAHCKKIVDMHQGSIEVESEPGVGSNFTFSLKLKPDNY